MTFVASIPRNASRNMGIFHASYGLGALMAPLVSTHFAQMQRWSFHFFTSLGLALINCALMLWVFKLKRQERAYTISLLRDIYDCLRRLLETKRPYPCTGRCVRKQIQADLNASSGGRHVDLHPHLRWD